MDMKKLLKRVTKKTEFYIALILIVFCLLVEVRSGQFFTPNNIVDLLRSMIIPTMFCIGEMMVLISGGVCAQGEVLTKPLTEFVQENAFAGRRIPTPPVHVASLGSDAGLIGAACLVG